MTARQMSLVTLLTNAMGTPQEAGGAARMVRKRPAPLTPSEPASPHLLRTPRRPSLHGPPPFPPPASPLPPIPTLPPTPTSPPRPTRLPPLPLTPSDIGHSSETLVPKQRPDGAIRLRSLSDVSVSPSLDVSTQLEALIPFFREGHPHSSLPPHPLPAVERFNVHDPSSASTLFNPYPSPRTSVSSSRSSFTSSRRHSFDAYSLLGQYPVPPAPVSGGGEVNRPQPLYPSPPAASFASLNLPAQHGAALGTSGMPIHPVPASDQFLPSANFHPSSPSKTFIPSPPNLLTPPRPTRTALYPRPPKASAPPPVTTSASVVLPLSPLRLSLPLGGGGSRKKPGDRKASEAWMWRM